MAFVPRYQKFESISLHRRVRRVRKLSTTNFWFQERRERYVKGITVLYNRERDIALATYDGEAAANAIFSLAEAIHGANIAMVARALNSEAEMLFEYGGDRGSNIHLIALIAVRRKLLDAASSNGERAVANRNLGLALQRLGERESGTARLEEAVKAYQAALEEWRRDRVPLDWAMTRTTSASRCRGSGNERAGRRGWRRQSGPTRRRWRNGGAIVCRSTGR